MKFVLSKEEDEEAMETELFTNIGQNQVVNDRFVNKDTNNYFADDYEDYDDYDDYDDYGDYND